MNVIGSGSPRKVPKARRMMRSASVRSPSLNGRTETSGFTSTIGILLSQPALVSRLFLFHHKQGDTSERQVHDSYALFLLTTGSICELPRRLIPGNWASAKYYSRKLEGHKKSRGLIAPCSCCITYSSECLVDAEAFDHGVPKPTLTLRKKESLLGMFVRLALWFLRNGKCQA